MEYSGDDGLVGGWTARRADPRDYTLSRHDGLGPRGQNVYRLVMDHNGPAGGDNDWGHTRTFTGAPFVYGGRAFFRWRFRWLPNTDCRAYEQGATGLLAGVWRNKVLIVNDYSSPASSRFNMNFDCERSPLQYRWRLAKGGGVDLANTPYAPVTTAWVDVQVELQYSSAANVADGAYRVWIDSNVRAAPTAAMTGILLHADVDPGYVQFGAYFNNGLFSDGSIGWEHADFQIDDQFDPSSH